MKINNLRTLAVTILTSSVLAACGGGGGGAAPAAPQTPAYPAAPAVAAPPFCTLTQLNNTVPGFQDTLTFSKIDATHFSATYATDPAFSGTFTLNMLNIAQNGVSYSFNPDIVVQPGAAATTFSWPNATYGFGGGTYAPNTKTLLAVVTTPASFVPGVFTIYSSYPFVAKTTTCTW